MNTHAEMIAVMQAAERGEPIRAIDRMTCQATGVLSEPNWNWGDFEYFVASASAKKVKTTKFLAWLSPMHGLRWLPESEGVTNQNYKRVPSEDKEIEVEE